MSDDQVQVKFGADTGPLKAGVGEAGAAVQTGTAQMAANFAAMSTKISESMNQVHSSIKESFGGIESMMSSLKGAMAGVTALVAGGAAFKEAVNATQEWDKESMKLAATMGITTEKATSLVVAGTSLGVSSDMISGAVKGMTRALSTNEKAFTDLGVSTRDSNGHYREAVDIMLDANKVLAETKEGFDRDIAGKKLYGRAWDEVRKIVKLTAEEMTAAGRRADALGLTVGPQGAAQTASYGKAMREMKETFTALWKVVGDAVIPILTKLAEWFNGIGPAAVNVFRAIINTAMIVVESFTGVLTVLYDVVKGVVAQVVLGFTLIGQVIVKALSGDLKGAARDAKAGWADMQYAWKKTTEEMTKDAEENKKRIDRLLQFSPEKEKSKPKTGGDRRDGGEGTVTKPESQIPFWREELEKTKELKRDFFKESTANDLAYWQQILAEGKASGSMQAKDRAEVGHIIFELEKKIATDGLAAQLQGMKTQIEAAMKGSQERITIAQREAELVKSKYGESSKEYIAAMGEVAKMQRERADDQIKRDDMVSAHKRAMDSLDIDMERQKVGYLKEIGAITDHEEITRLKELEQQKWEIDKQALEAKLAAQKQGSTEGLAALEALAEGEKKHNAAMLSLDLKDSSESLHIWKGVYDNIAASFSSAIQKMVLSGGKLKDAMKGIASSILSTFIDMGVKWAADWIYRQLFTTTATAAATTAKTGIVTAGAGAQAAAVATGSAAIVGTTGAAAVATTAIVVPEATAQITAHAGVGAAGAAASQAWIPGIGPALAVAAGAAMLAMILGFAGKSASGGFDIPSGMNPVTQLHQEEMVLPAHIANPLRAMLASGGGSGNSGMGFSMPGWLSGVASSAVPSSSAGAAPAGMSGGDTTVHNYHTTINAMDAASFRTFAERNKSAFAGAVTSHIRNFGKT